MADGKYTLDVLFLNPRDETQSFYLIIALVRYLILQRTDAKELSFLSFLVSSHSTR